MAISRAQQEALNKLRSTRPSEPMATFFETLFPEAIPASARAPLIKDAMALFEEHWTAEDGVEVPVYAHDAIALLGRTASGWRTDNARYQASANLAAELQAKVAALEARLANPTPDDSASKTSNSAEDPPQKLHNGAQRGGNTDPGNDQGPAASTISTEGSAQNDFRLLSRLAPFSGNPADGEDFLNSFIARSRLCTDEDRLYWFGILCGPACTLWFERAKFPTWEAACKAFKAGYTIRVRTKDALCRN